MKIFKVDENKVKINNLFKLHKEGVKFVCSKCSHELVSAFTKDEARKLEIAPGIHCSYNLNHVNIHFNIK